MEAVIEKLKLLDQERDRVNKLYEDWLCNSDDDSSFEEQEKDIELSPEELETLTKFTRKLITDRIERGFMTGFSEQNAVESCLKAFIRPDAFDFAGCIGQNYIEQAHQHMGWSFEDVNYLTWLITRSYLRKGDKEAYGHKTYVMQGKRKGEELVICDVKFPKKKTKTTNKL